MNLRRNNNVDVKYKVWDCKQDERFSMGIVTYQGLIYIVGGCTHSRRHMQVLRNKNGCFILVNLQCTFNIKVFINLNRN